MKLYLASTFANVAKSFIDIFNLVPSENKVAFVANASDPYPEHAWTDVDRNKLVDLGFIVEDIDLRTIQGDELRQKLSNVDIIFVAGGNVTYLLDIARKSGFIEIIKELKESGKIYVGSSAGSILAGPSIEPYYEMEQDELKETGYPTTLTSFEAIGLVDFVMLPHYNNPKERKEFDTNIIPKFKDRFTLLTKEDDEAVAVKDLETINISK